MVQEHREEGLWSSSCFVNQLIGIIISIQSQQNMDRVAPQSIDTVKPVIIAR